MREVRTKYISHWKRQVLRHVKTPSAKNWIDAFSKRDLTWVIGGGLPDSTESRARENSPQIKDLLLNENNQRANSCSSFVLEKEIKENRS